MGCKDAGEKVEHGGVLTRTVYNAESVLEGEKCKGKDQTKTCLNGVLTDWDPPTDGYNFKTCIEKVIN